MDRSRKWAMASVGVAAVAVLLLIGAFLFPWYLVSYDGQPGSTESFGLSSDTFPTNGPANPGNLTATSSLSSIGLPVVAQLYADAEYLVGAAVAVGLGSVVLVPSLTRGRLRWIPVGTFAIAGALALAGPVGLALEQPRELCRELGPSGGVDWPGPTDLSSPDTGCGWAWELGGGSFFGPTAYGPQSSFSGSAPCGCDVAASSSSYVQQNVTNSWGPSTGWYLAIGAGALFGVGGALQFLSKRIEGRIPRRDLNQSPPGP